MSTTYDVAIIGGGPGGYVAAIRASQLGLNPVLIEREHLGGICLNWGCIPTKALLRSAEIYNSIKHAEEFGITVEKASFDFDKIIKRSRDVSKKLTQGVGYLMKKNKVTVIEGTAKLTGKNSLSVKTKDGEQKISAKNIIIATGARARNLKDLEPDGKFIWTYKEALLPDEMPKRLCVIGSGAIGVEFANFFNALGSEVTIVEMADRITPAEDEEISAMAQKAFQKAGITIKTGSTVSAINKSKKQIELTIKTGNKEEPQNFDRVIVAIGIVPNVEDIGLEALSIEMDRGFIKTDGYGNTNIEGVFAIGDVTNPPWLAHKASHEGIIAIETIAGHKVAPLDPMSIPGCTYTSPQIASVGMTEKQATEAGHKIKVGRFPFQANGKALALGEPDGMIKTIFDEKTGELLGAHMIGAEVTELIQGYTVAQKLETTEHELMETVFPHPTLSEMMHEAVLDAYGKALHF
ncbi:MAG: dihydrolipoyl dehydrogenase [Rhodomicrobium sp.]|nr:MAG: dihydrolipoyl dehydrogenase [Rhodomicrobium sp.]